RRAGGDEPAVRTERDRAEPLIRYVFCFFGIAPEAGDDLPRSGGINEDHRLVVALGEEPTAGGEHQPAGRRRAGLECLDDAPGRDLEDQRASAVDGHEAGVRAERRAADAAVATPPAVGDVAPDLAPARQFPEGRLAVVVADADQISALGREREAAQAR